MLKIIVIGKMKNRALAELAEDYRTRLSRYCPVEILEFKDTDPEKEAERIIEALKNFKGKIYAMTEEGRTLTSKKLSETLEGDLLCGGSAFIIGGPYGLSTLAKARAGAMLSLSPMTFTHEMARVILLEQLYRAKSISAGSGYHH